MSIAGQHMDGVALEQPFGGASHSLSPGAGQRRRGYLHRAAQLHPLQNALRRPLQNRIAFRMSDHRSDANLTQACEAFIELYRNAVVTQLHQQIIAPLDGVASRRIQRVLQVVVRKMKIAPQT